jgi:hypothetical protein
VEDLADDGLRPVLADVPALDWRAGPMPTFVVDAADSEVYTTATYRLAATSPRPLEVDELAVERATAEVEWEDHGSAVTYVMRSTAAGWVLSGLGW